LRFLIHVLMMAIRLQSLNGLKSPERFTGGRAVHWMCVTFTVTLLEDHPFFIESVLIRNCRRIFTNCADPMHQRCSLKSSSGCD
ncbi:MAG: hypothetical protein RSE38_04210, partial [Acinetobacter sp.]